MADISEKCSTMVQELEQLHRQGQSDLVRESLQKLNLKKIPRKDFADVANLARRVGMPLMAIRLLNPVIRTDKIHVVPTARECSEYGVALQSIGARNEALKLLNEVDADEVPQALLYRSFCYFSHWQYDQAIPHLQRYIDSSRLTDYERVIGQVNLAASLVFVNDFAKAHDLLLEIKQNCQKNEYTILYGNSLELQALNAINSKDYKLARDLLLEASVYLKSTRRAESLYVKKWLAIIDFIERPNGKKELAVLDKLKQQAAKESQWELMRDIDLHVSIASHDRRLFSYVFFGTPIESFRSNAIKKLWSEWRPSNNLVLAPENRNPERILDLKTGEENGERILKPAMINHRLISVLIGDFYRPRNVGSIFSALFPDEYYSPVSSLDRVHQAVSRLKKWIHKNQVPMQVIERNGFYSLKILDGFGCRITIEDEVTCKEQVQILRLKEKLYDKTFTSTEASQVLDISRATFSRVVSWGQDQGVIQKVGVGKDTKYRLVG